jgi:L-galactose dehydrogenase
LIQCHDIEFGSLEQVVNETLPALRQAQQQGKVGFVGITGLPLKVFSTVMAQAEIDTILSYCRYELNDTSLEGLLPTLKTKGIGVINASPLGMGLLTERGAPDWHPAPVDIQEACAQAAAHCHRRGVDIAQLAIQFSVSNPDIATTLVGTANPRNIEKNIKWLESPLDQELLAEVLAILKPVHNQTWPSGRLENNEL